MQKRILLILAVLAAACLLAAPARAISLPAGLYRASATDRSNFFKDLDGDGSFETPEAPGPPPVIGDENRSLYQVDGANFGQLQLDLVGVPEIKDKSPTAPAPVPGGVLSGMLYDVVLGAGSAVPPGGPSIVAPWFLDFVPGTRYLSGGGSDGTWTDMAPSIGPATSAAGFGGLLVIYDDPVININFALGPGAWVEGAIPAPDPSLTFSDHFPTISDVAPWLVAVLAPLPPPIAAFYGVVTPGTVMAENLFGVANQGIAFANVIGGTAAGLVIPNVFGPMLDIRIEFEPDLVPTDGWQTASDDPVQLGIVPEPATLSLLGMSLLGLIGVRFRRKK